MLGSPADDDVNPMHVIKRNGVREPVSFDKVLERIRRAARGLTVNYTRLAQLVLAEIHDGVHTSELDELAARIAVSYMTTHPDWGTLAAQIIISNCQRSAPKRFSDAAAALAPSLHPDVAAFIQANSEALDAMVTPANDFLLDYFGFKTLERAYLLRDPTNKDRILETPQYMWLRVAIGIHHQYPDALSRIEETYQLMSAKAFTHATPTLFNSGTPRPQLSSCFLIAMKDDSVDGIFDTLKQCANISKYAGGIGLHIHNIRAAGSHINGTNGTSDGIMPMLRVFNNTARYINQGGRRNGSFAVYLEPWHADIQAFLKMKSNTGSEEERARDLFYALWVPDLFMKRVEAGGDWSLFCPHEAPGLADAVGPAFEELYTKYEAEGKAKRSIPAQKLWSEILVSQIETGTPYLLYKDAANMKSNQQNLGTIKSSNLCVAPETLILTDKGSFPIVDLVDQEVNVWNGDAWSPTVVRKTGTRQKLIKVTVDINCCNYNKKEYTTVTGRDYINFKRVLTCTPYHKFILPTHDKIADCERIDASQLKPGQALKCYITQNFCTYTGEWKNTPAYEVTVTKVEDFGRYDDTYCFTEEQNHAGVFNGILTGQCAEIVEYSNDEETAVCNLASLALPYFIEQTLTGPVFNFDKLRAVTAVAVRNLNRVIDINYYPTPETERSNMRHRPIGLGVQGLADVFAQLGLAWESPEAAALNREIFENIYYAALEQSHLEALQKGSYSTFAGSPASKGILQPDLWGSPPSTAVYLDWGSLRTRVQRDGLRNSLVMALMPTASTSQVLGYNEAMEPFTSNIYARRTLAGEFTVVNKYLVTDLMDAGLWSPELKERIIAANGSIQGLPEVPPQIKERYKTVWEIKQKTLIDMAADRGAFICQSQSLNLFVQEPTIAKLSSMHFYAWKKGLKTGIYYLRTKSAVQAIKFTVDPAVMKQQQQSKDKDNNNPQECLLCSS
jgi:ribonucleotide reductase alpha subunit